MPHPLLFGKVRGFLSRRGAQTSCSVGDWDREYATGAYREKWELGGPSPDLVGVLSGLQLVRGSVVVDVGCGSGSETLYLASKGFTVTGVDISRTALEIALTRARSAGWRITFCVASALELPFAPASCDLVNDRGCLHSLTRDKWPEYARQLATVLRTGGYALIRGCSDARQSSAFTCLSAANISRYFDDSFECRALEPLRLCSSRGHITALLVLLQRRCSDHADV